MRRNNAITLGRLVLATCTQGGGAPILDPATTHHHDGAWRCGGDPDPSWRPS